MSVEPPHRSDLSSLYRATIAPLRNYLARLLGSEQDAADVAHDAYLRVKDNVDRHTAANPKALLYTTARHLALNQIKRRQHSPIAGTTGEADLAPAPSPGVVQTVMARQELAQLEAAIRELPAGCRSVLLLRKIDLLSHQEIADRLGIAISTVEKQHARALRLLRAALQPAMSSDLEHLP
ncbi:MAG: RNA polymerase sigma factor [Lacunisphaera sp.]|nr:RNA polymerase sigma factor [Lacunisphaera sp.]